MNLQTYEDFRELTLIHMMAAQAVASAKLDPSAMDLLSEVKGKHKRRMEILGFGGQNMATMTDAATMELKRLELQDDRRKGLKRIKERLQSALQLVEDIEDCDERLEERYLGDPLQCEKRKTAEDGLDMATAEAQRLAKKVKIEYGSPGATRILPINLLR